jgi:hypothetical protein
MNMEKCHWDISEIEKRFNGEKSPKMLADCSWNLKKETPTGEWKKQKRRSESFMTNLFVVRIQYRGSVQYLTVYIVIKNQHVVFFIKNVLFVYNSSFLKIGGRWRNLVVIFGFSNVKAIRITLNFNREREIIYFADQRIGINRYE